MAGLSSLMDGEADMTAVQKASACWRDDPAARSTWHAYHLIGDVMRSDDLASPPGHDAAFLAALRVKLAAEPALLAPTPVLALAAASPPRRQAWLMPAAMAAGFVAVAGVLLVTRQSAPEPATTPLLASGSVATDGMQRVVRAPDAGSPLVLGGAPGDARMIRDAQLDAYLRAHRGMRGGAAAALPGGELRGLETVSVRR
jgi:sigma-E factor negative regulatory protein RseA